MPTLTPDTRLRVSLDELPGVAIQGDPGTATLTYLSDGSTAEYASGGTIAAKTCPDIIEVSWEMSGVTVSAELDLVGRRYCTLDDIRAYRPSEYDLAECTDEQVWQARANAEAVIEAEAHRFFQPVLRAGIVDRPNCTMAAMPLIPDACPRDIFEVVRATDEGGNSVTITPSGKTALNVSHLRAGGCANVVLRMGMRHTPAEMHDAVVSLAAWELLPKAAPDNAISTSTDSGVLRFVVGGIGGAATSLPEVNTLITRYGFKDLNVG